MCEKSYTKPFCGSRVMSFKATLFGAENYEFENEKKKVKKERHNPPKSSLTISFYSREGDFNMGGKSEALQASMLYMWLLNYNWKFTV